jgi:pimeloyl-ACP methyl ester carboxylesterase
MIAELYFEADEDQGGKPALLLLHGALSSRRHWLPNRAALSQHFRIVLAELPAHGRSPAPSDPAAYRPEALVGALDAVREKLGIARWHICGQSFGAGLTLRYALMHPGRVVGQVFTNGNVTLRPPFGPEQNTANAERIARLRAFGREELRQQKFHPRFAKRFPPDIREMLTEDADRIDLEGMIKLLELTLPVLTVRPIFAETAVPTLLVNGRWERGFQPLRDWAAEALPRLRVVDLEGGHSINIEQPEAFNRAVIDFLLPLE